MGPASGRKPLVPAERGGGPGRGAPGLRAAARERNCGVGGAGGSDSAWRRPPAPAQPVEGRPGAGKSFLVPAGGRGHPGAPFPPRLLAEPILYPSSLFSVFFVSFFRLEASTAPRTLTCGLGGGEIYSDHLTAFLGA